MTDTTATGMRGPGIFLAQFMSAEAPFDTLANIARWAASQGYKAIQLPTLGTQYIDLARAAESQSYCDELKAVCAEAGVEISELSTHLQGLNDMCNGGFRRGEFIMTSALPHMNKTGFGLDVFEGVARFNEPYLFDVKKKPLLLRISFEDDVEMNFNHLFKHMWERENNEIATTADKDPEAIAEYVMKRMTETGWHVHMHKVDPSMWTIFDVFAFVRELEADGYEVAMCMLDYMRKMPTTGCMQGVAGFDVRDMARRSRNFFNSRKTTFYTPHQVSTQGKEISRMTPNGFVKMLPNGGFYDGCKSLDAEIDLEIFQHIEQLNGHKYLTLQRGKHRNAPQIPEDKKYIVYAFNDIAGIPPDIGKENTVLRKVGGKRQGQESEEYSFMD